MKMKPIPTIDFCKELKAGTAAWDTTKDQVLNALQEYGCFEAIYDDVEEASREEVFATSKKAFEPPLEDKLKEYIAKPYHRYDGQIPRIPFYDRNRSSADLLLPHSVETFSDTFWPHGNPNYCNAVKSYANSLMRLDEMVKRMVLEGLGVKDYIDEFLEPTFHLLRFTHYKPAKDDKNAFGAHTDGSYLTIIKQNQAGLQVLNKKNGEWIGFDTSPNSYVVLSADAFMGWTNGRLHSAVHKVTGGDVDRFSVQLFSSPIPDFTIAAPRELVDEQHPSLFKPYNSLGFFEYVMSGAARLKNEGDSILKAYCGV